MRAQGAVSQWLTLYGAMPRSSWLGSISFLVMIDDLAPGCIMHKYVDDTTLTEVLKSNDRSSIQHYFCNLINWIDENDMQVNTKKIKEIVFGSWARHNIDLLTSSSGEIERMSHFKLLGVYIEFTLAWNIHIDYITKKAAQRLCFLKNTQKVWLNIATFAHYYVVAIRPILEYCSSLWAHNLPTYLSDQIGSIQKRATRIIHNPTIGMPCISALTYAYVESLKIRRETQAREFFKKILSPISCLHSLLQPPRVDAILTRLRNPHRFPINHGTTKHVSHSSIVG